MKIDKSITNILQDTHVRTAKAKAQGAKAGDTKQNTGTFDKIEISTRTNELKTLIEKVKASPDVRQDKVDSIREAIQNGTYDVQGKLVAKEIIKSSLLDEIL